MADLAACHCYDNDIDDHCPAVGLVAGHHQGQDPPAVRGDHGVAAGFAADRAGILSVNPDAPRRAPWRAVGSGDRRNTGLQFHRFGDCLGRLFTALRGAADADRLYRRSPRNAGSGPDLGSDRRDAFLTIALPLARRGFITGAVLSFAHTVGEFGVVLMVGGNIPGKTRVISIEIFSAVETLDYKTAHKLSAWLLVLSLIVLTLVYVFNRRGGARVA